ncbi:DUF4250 domain-containing protein [Salinibius halmophilus]|uniref:DUF4250 domain-containing protein n=1 Tax=Salinibius halmophilus TaxID=1853216 RepID=UPI000E66094D|nr:DUF4250 domain-containing protein [Salinibius halmophilus]
MMLANYQTMDINLLFSLVNQQLRDQFSSLEKLCAYHDIEQAVLEARLHSAGFDYLPEANQFR